VIGFLVWLCGVIATADVVLTGGGAIAAACAVLGALLFLIYVGALMGRKPRHRSAPITRNRAIAGLDSGSSTCRTD
jgi:hypothetical protein